MMRGGLNLATSKICYLLSFTEFQFSTSGQKLTLYETEKAEWKGMVRASLWAYLKILDLVSNEYPDPRLIIYAESELKT